MTPNEAQSRHQVFNGLQAGRFFAAGSVMMFHVYLIAPKSGKPFGTTFDAGFLGVDFFFVLSGFIMLFIHWNDIGKKDKFRNFATKRFVRIYPLYFVMVCATAAIVFAFPNLGPSAFRQPAFILQNFFLLPTDGEPLVGISWTLQHEMLFYVLFGILIISPKTGSSLLAAWFVGSALVGLVMPYPLSWITEPRHLEFLFGMIGAYLLRTTIIPRPRLVLLLGLFLLGCIVFVCDLFLQYGAHDLPGDFLIRTPLYLPAGLASLLIIVGCVEAERQRLLVVPVAFAFLGDISYALYLTHGYVLDVYRKGVKFFSISNNMPPELTALGLVVVAVCVAILAHFLIEKPAMQILRGWTAPRQKPVLATLN